MKYCVIGLGYFGYHLSVSLSKAGAEVLAIDNHQDKIDEISDKVATAVCMDASDKKTLASLGLDDMDAVIVAIGGDFEGSLLTTAHLQDLGIKKIYNRRTSKVHERILNLMDIHEILVPEAEAAEQLKNRLMIPGLIESFKLSSDYGIYEIETPKKFIGKNLIETNLREDFKLNLVTIKRKSTEKTFLNPNKKEKYNVIGVPKPNELIKEGDVLVLFGKDKDIKNLLEE
ncbi:MAG: TrkA family potassium uptake protein [bacterium]